MGKKGKMISFSWFCSRKIKGREDESSSFSLRYTKFRRSEFVWPIMKVHRIDEGYAWVPKMRYFSENPNEEFGKSKFSSLGSVHEASDGFFYSQRGSKFFIL